MNRLGIFVFYDKEGIVNRYIAYLLAGIRAHLSRLVIVCNGALTDEGKCILREFSDEIHVRENTGFDAMAYKLAMTDYLGWDEVCKYDEVLLFNDTFYGPVYPFSEMFGQMEKKSCDFWGITYHERFRDYIFGTDTITPAHIHTYFCVYRHSVLISDVFRNYWDAFDSTEWFFSDVCRHEQMFTEVLEKGGFTWKAYVETASYNDAGRVDENVNPYFTMACDLMKYHRCPILKRKNFSLKNLSRRTGTGGEDIAKALQFIRRRTDYDDNLIWENILRLYNVYEIRNALHLEYALPWAIGGNAVDASVLEKTAVIICVPDGVQLQDLDEYLKKIPGDIHVRKATDESQMRKDMQALGKQYGYLCVISLHRAEAGEPLTVVKSLNYNLLENTIKSGAYINHVLNLFEQNERLGVLAVPMPVHADYLGEIGEEWGNAYEDVDRLAGQMGLHANLAPEIPCLMTEHTFWCRTDAVRPALENMPACDGDVLARIYPYVAQSEGYYTGIVMNSDYASLQSTNLSYDLRGALKKCREKKRITDYDSLFETDIVSVVEGYANVMIYGAGSDGIKVSNMLKKEGVKVEGFIISDDQPGQKEKNGLPIYRLSEVPFEKDATMVLVAVRYARDQNVIMENLRKKGWKNYYHYLL